MHPWIPTLYKWEGEACQPTPTPWIPPHTTKLQGDLPAPLTHNNTQQHYTTALGYIKLPMYLLFLWPYFFGPKWHSQKGSKKSWFSGPAPSDAPCNDVAPLKIITYRAIKTTGTLIVILYYCPWDKMSHNFKVLKFQSKNNHRKDGSPSLVNKLWIYIYKLRNTYRCQYTTS